MNVYSQFLTRTFSRETNESVLHVFFLSFFLQIMLVGGYVTFLMKNDIHIVSPYTHTTQHTVYYHIIVHCSNISYFIMFIHSRTLTSLLATHLLSRKLISSCVLLAWSNHFIFTSLSLYLFFIYVYMSDVDRERERVRKNSRYCTFL